MSIRLTNESRKVIQSAIYKATEIPGKLDQLEKDIKAFFTQIAKNQVPKEFTDATKHLPKNWLAVRSNISAVSGTNFYNPVVAPHSWSTNVTFNDTIAVPNDFQFKEFTLADLKKHPELQEMLAEVVVWREKKKEIEAELASTLAAYNTVEKLLKDFPEFAKHCPDRPVYALTVNPERVALKLMKAGFDITVKPAVVTKAVVPVTPAKKPRTKKVKV